MNASDSFDNKIDELEARINYIANRMDVNSGRRALATEFGRDLIEKSKQGKNHLTKLKNNYLSFWFSRLLHPKNGKKQLTKTLDSYEALSTKIKGISDNLGSFVSAVYLDSNQIQTQIEKFERKPTLARNISATQLKQVKNILPKLIGGDLEEVMSEQYIKFSPFFEHHRNTTQHGKIDQNLIIDGKKITFPENTIYKGSEEISVVKGLERVLDNYITLAGRIVERISGDKIKDLTKPNDKEDSKIHRKVMRKELGRNFKKLIFAAGLASMIGAPTYMFLELKEGREKAENANVVLMSMYNAQDNKKVIDIGDLITQKNTEEINKTLTRDLRKANTHIDTNLGEIYGNSSRNSLGFFKGKELQEYVNLIKLIKETEKSTVDSIVGFLDANHSFSNPPAKYISKVVEYVETMHDSLDNLVLKKLEMDASIINPRWDYEDASDDPIVKDLQMAVFFSQRMFSRYAPGLSSEEANKLLLDPEVVVRLSEDFDGTMKDICKKLNISKTPLLYDFLVNNTPYLKHISTEITDLDEIKEHVTETIIKNRRLVESSVHGGNPYQYEAFAQMIYERTNGQRPLRSLKMPDIFDRIDTVFTDSYLPQARPEFETMIKDINEDQFKSDSN